MPKRSQNPEDGANTQAFAILAPVVICTEDVKNVDQLDTDNDGLDLNFLHLFSKYA